MQVLHLNTSLCLRRLSHRSLSAKVTCEALMGVTARRIQPSASVGRELEPGEKNCSTI